MTKYSENNNSNIHATCTFSSSSFFFPPVSFYLCSLCGSTLPGAAIAQWVERQAEKPGSIPSGVRVPGVSGDCSPRVSLQCRLSDGVPTAPVATVCINICAHVKNPKHWQPYHCLDTQKYCTYSRELAALLFQLLCLAVR